MGASGKLPVNFPPGSICNEECHTTRSRRSPLCLKETTSNTGAAPTARPVCARSCMTVRRSGMATSEANVGRRPSAPTAKCAERRISSTIRVSILVVTTVTIVAPFDDRKTGDNKFTFPFPPRFAPGKPDKPWLRNPSSLDPEAVSAYNNERKVISMAFKPALTNGPRCSFTINFPTARCLRQGAKMLRFICLLVTFFASSVFLCADQPYCAFEVKVSKPSGVPFANVPVIMVQRNAQLAETRTNTNGEARLCDAPLSSVDIMVGFERCGAVLVREVKPLLASDYASLCHVCRELVRRVGFSARLSHSVAYSGREWSAHQWRTSRRGHIRGGPQLCRQRRSWEVIPFY